jgi:hypothetical protein
MKVNRLLLLSILALAIGAGTAAAKAGDPEQNFVSRLADPGR